jgi:hypothetical protein
VQDPANAEADSMPQRIVSDGSAWRLAADTP